MIPALVVALACSAAPEDFALDNGLRVVLAPEAHGTQVTVLLRYEAGHAQDPEGYAGLAHVVEHLVHRGTRHLPGLAGTQHVVRVGGDHNAFTTPEATLYFSTVPASELALPLWVESDRMAFALETFDAETLEHVKQIVRHESDERGASLGEFAELLASIRYPEGHPYRRDHRADDDAVDDLELDHARWFFQQHYRPDNATLVVTGRFDPAAARAEVERYFGPIVAPRGRRPRAPAPAVLFDNARRVKILARLPIPIWMMTWHVPRSDARRRVATEVFAAVLDARLEGDLEDLVRASEVGVRHRDAHSEITLVAIPTEDEAFAAIEAKVRSALLELERDGVTKPEWYPLAMGIETQYLTAREEPLSRAHALAADQIAPEEAIEALAAFDARQLAPLHRWVNLYNTLIAEVRFHRYAARYGEIDDIEVIAGPKGQKRRMGRSR